MVSFAAAADQTEASRLPVVEGVTARVAAGANDREVMDLVTQVLVTQVGGDWVAQARGGGWFDALPADRAAAPPALDRVWDAVRLLGTLPGVAAAEPLLLVRVPAGDAQEVNARLGIWGIPYDPATEARIEAASQPHDWSLEQLKVPAAWRHGRQQQRWDDDRLPGDGIRVIHPDTGYTPHPQVAAILDGTGQNFVEAERPNDARDDLAASGLLPVPGHGTGTASVIASPAREGDADAEVLGVAPGARVRPLRVSTSVVHLSFHTLVLALEAAIADQAHVVSMSLGGPHAPAALREVVQRALDAGIIVVAAAGNYLPTVVFPAALPGVIACAASNAIKLPWRLSGFGEEVVITAPGERVWRATAALGADGRPDYRAWPGDGTSFATAAVAGLAALWLSFHGRDSLLQRFGAPLLPFAFALHLQRTADAAPDFVDGGRGGFGAGIADAERLVKDALPSRAEASAARDRILRRGQGSLIGLALRELGMLFRVPTRAPDGAPRLAGDSPTSGGESGQEVGRALLTALLGVEPDDPAIVIELATLIAGRPALHRAGLSVARRGAPAPPTLVALRRRLLELPLSAAARRLLLAAQAASARDLPGGEPVEVVLRRAAPTAPAARRLRAFAYDPSLANEPDTVGINAVTITIPFERDLGVGPVGDYLEVVDIDPATGCAYPPVDLNHPALLAQDGLPQSVGNPQFHQQMVYAVAMKTIGHFENALGRPIFWSPLRPWREGHDAVAAELQPQSDRRDRFVRRLRLYPHALREANAYYSPAKRAVLFGYFPAQEDDPGREYPGGIVFTCLSHDIIAHEMTHAILDGMHVSFTEPSNPDVLAFHEAFADIVALFQHFTYPEVLRDQIARARGNLTSQTLLSQLAQQFGLATGRRHALRDAIGTVAVSARQMTEEGRPPAEGVTPAGEAAGERATPAPRHWMRYQPDPFLLPTVVEAHARGAILVAAVFDAFLTIYDQRVADLTRIATGGTGVLPSGRLHPDLVNRMADEAAKAADHVLRICVRAMDYVPPVDITFGEFLRALITADSDLVPRDERGYRVAFLAAFRRWGIYPRDVRTLSEESLRWHSPRDLSLFPAAQAGNATHRRIEQLLRRAVLAWGPTADREAVFANLQAAQAMLNTYLRQAARRAADRPWLAGVLPGIDLERSFSLANLRPARRVGPNGEFLTEMIFEVIQIVERPADPARGQRPFYAGVTVVVGLDDWLVRYTIYKRGVDQEGRLNHFRLERQRRYEEQRAASLGAAAMGAAEYRCAGAPAALDRRGVDREAMRASSCQCRARRMAGADADPSVAEPFALLHQGEE